MSRSTLPPATIILATRDRPADLARALASLQELDYDAGLSILVIDQTPGAPATEPPPPGPHPVRVIRQDAVGKSRALNLALEAAPGDVLLFTDDDCTVPATWARRMVEALVRRPDTGLVFSRVEPVEHDRQTLFIPDFLPARTRRFTSAWRGRRFAGLGASMAARREALLTVGGFDERLGPGSHFGNSEDSDAAYRVLRSGYAVVHTADTGVTHYGGRLYATGAAREIVVRSYFSFGAMCARALRSGDAVALALFAYDLAEAAGGVAINAIRGRRPLGLRRPGALLRGFWSGLRDGSPRRAPSPPAPLPDTPGEGEACATGRLTA